MEWITPAIGLFRVFVQPIGPRDPETGQPWKPWQWFTVITLEGSRLTACGSSHAPTLAMMKLSKFVARDLGATVILWERWSCGRKRFVEVPL
jgi:hypothetical protein